MVIGAILFLLVGFGIWYRCWSLAIHSKGGLRPISGELLIVGMKTSKSNPTVLRYHASNNMLSSTPLPKDVVGSAGDVLVLDTSHTAFLQDRPWSTTVVVCSKESHHAIDLTPFSKGQYVPSFAGTTGQGRTLVLSGDELIMLNIVTKQCSYVEYPGAWVHHAELGAGNRLFAAIRADAPYSYCLVDARTGRITKTLPYIEGEEPVISHSGEQIAFPTTIGVEIYNLTANGWRHRLTISGLRCDRVRWSPDDKYLACELPILVPFLGIRSGVGEQLYIAATDTGRVMRVPVFACKGWNWCPE